MPITTFTGSELSHYVFGQEQTMEEQDLKNPPTTDPNMVPASRNDAVGDLARQLFGTDDTPPDFTAAPLLFDALMGEGDVAMAMRVRADITVLVSHVGRDESGGMNARERVNRLEHMKSALYSILYPCLFDFASICGVLAAHVVELVKKDEVKEGSTTLATVRVWVPEHARIGHMFPIDEARNGIMVSVRGTDGKADLVPQDDSDMEHGESPARYAQPYPMGPMRNTRLNREQVTEMRRIMGTKNPRG